MKVAQLLESGTPLVISMLIKLLRSGQPVDYYIFVSNGQYEEDGTPLGAFSNMGEITEASVIAPHEIYAADLHVTPPGHARGSYDRYYIRREYLDNTFLKKFSSRWRLYSGAFPAFPSEQSPT